jgi:PAS domain S-box-containing protein
MAQDQPAHIVLFGDDPGVAALLQQRLQQASHEVVVAAEAEAAHRQILQGGVELLVLGCVRPDGGCGTEFYRRLNDSGHSLPAILVTASRDEAEALAALRAGVRDVLTTSPQALDYLPEAVARVLRQARTERRLAEAEARYRDLVETTSEGVWAVDAQGRTTYANGRLAELLGYRADEMLGRPVDDFLFPRDWQRAGDSLERRRQGLTEQQEIQLRGRDEHAPWVLASCGPLRGPGGEFRGALGLLADITERRLMEERLREQAALLDQANDAILVRDLGDGITYWNQGAERLYGWRAAEACGQNSTALLFTGPSPEVEEARRQVRERGEWHGELHQVTRDGRPVVVASRRTLLRDADGAPKAELIINSDITEQKRLEAQLLQAQRMEAVGRLAGGVAHDFNNLLTVINGYAELLLANVPPEGPAYEPLREIQRAGGRAAGLTRQLLAFSRKQLLKPVVLDLNALLRELEKMLLRLIGEDIDLATRLAPGLGRVRADAGQLEQVVMNLIVNARDAMPTGGRLTLETHNVELAPSYAEGHPYVRPGPYVLLAVSDTGCGMDEATRARIFEPFFTTKAPGQGTGLGLSTVYGIVKQSGGSVEVYSEPGRGSTFKIYLPRLEGADAAATPSSAELEVPRGRETVLLAEDEDGVRAFVVLALEVLGYTVLQARDGAEALALCRDDPRPIHLLITDVVMPRMSGRELAERVAALRPGLKVLYLSGYTDDAVVRHGLLQEGVAFLQKPFTPAVLARKVRQVLGG